MKMVATCKLETVKLFKYGTSRKILPIGKRPFCNDQSNLFIKFMKVSRLLFMSEEFHKKFQIYLKNVLVVI